MNYLIILVFLFTISDAISNSNQAFFEIYNFPEYHLSNNANAKLGPWKSGIRNGNEFFTIEIESYLIKGNKPTERIINFADLDNFDSNNFSFEFWIMNHVNNPVGFSLILANRANPSFKYIFYFQTDSLNLWISDENEMVYTAGIDHKKAWKEIFSHLCFSKSENQIYITLNGDVLFEKQIEPGTDKLIDYIELGGFFSNEPFMKLENLIKCLRIYQNPLSMDQIKNNEAQFKELAEKGILFSDLFHFNAGPYLNNVSKNSIALIWETSAPSKAALFYGKSLPLREKIVYNEYQLISEITIIGLEPQTQYFYQLECTDANGNKIQTDVLTFSTAVKDTTESVRFAVIGDTESRPHINNQIAQRVWAERPHFAIQLGDLTDGGKRPNKFEWNYEYFNGMRSLISRVPLFPVPGNGEGDLYWYKKYHNLPDIEDYYSFQYGNAEFFMLNSVAKSDFELGGKQIEWLSDNLRKSKAKWKFVALHYAPYSSDENDYGDTWKGSSDFGDLIIRNISSICEKYEVDIVFFGHLHSYERTYPINLNRIDHENGVIYIQSGGAGGNLEDFAPTPTWFSAKVFRDFHYSMVYLHNDMLEFRMMDLNGAIVDLFNIRKD